MMNVYWTFRALWRKGLLHFILLLFCNIPVYGNETDGYVVKQLGNLFAVDIGILEGLIPGERYKFYRNIQVVSTNRYDIAWDYVGIAQVMQVEENISIMKFLVKFPEKEIEEGDLVRISAYEKLYTPAETEEADKKRFYLKKIKPAPTVKGSIVPRKLSPPIQRNYPIGLVLNSLTGYENFPDAITRKIENLFDEIFFDSFVTSRKRPWRMGFATEGEVIFASYLGIRGGIGQVKYEQTLESSLAFLLEDVPPENPPDEYVESWDITMRTRLRTASVSLLVGDFHHLIDWVKNKPDYRRYILYGGIGIEFVTVEYDTDERIGMHRFGFPNSRTDNQEFKLDGFWGTTAFAGVGYLTAFGKFFAEVGYTRWNEPDWKSSYPSRIGFSVYF